MRKLSPIPADFEIEPNGQPTESSNDLRMLMDELKDAISAPKSPDRDLSGALRELGRAVGDLKSNNGEQGSGAKLRLGVFVDTANLTDRDPDDPIRVDFAKLLDHVTADRRLIHARAYCPIYSDFNGRLEHQRSVASVWGKGYDIVTKPIKVFADGTRKADLDIVLVIDAIRRLPTMDAVALMSGDGDYVPMVDYLREHGLRVEVYSFSDAIAEELRLAADEWHDITAMTSLHLKGRAAGATVRTARSAARV